MQGEFAQVWLPLLARGCAKLLISSRAAGWLRWLG
jgi:hypothetical protein